MRHTPFTNHREYLMNNNQPIEKILRETKTIAVVGFSSKEGRAKGQGYAIYAVNPTLSEGLGGDPAYATLADVPAPVDEVLIFQRSENVPPFVDQAIAIGARAVWMQEGIVNEAAAAKARAAGLDVVQDACMMVEHKRWAGR